MKRVTKDNPLGEAALSAGELAFCGLFGAAALLFPVVFHMVRLGHIFMPMYLPLVTLAFFVRPLPAAATALVVPVLSGAVTGMPPFYPPVAVFMSLELTAISALIAAVTARRPKVKIRLVLFPALLFGRVLYVGLVYVFSLAVELPAGFLAGLSFLSGWPGIVLMMVVVPPVVGLRRERGRPGRVAATKPAAKRPHPLVATASSAGSESAGSEPEEIRTSSSSEPDSKASFFDRIAEKWDGWENLSVLAPKLAAGIEEFGVRPDEAILDVGCGTGNLTRALLDRLSSAGRIVAVDISSRMIEEARRKVQDGRVEWHVADVRRLPLPDSSCDRAICFSVWPHIDNWEAAVRELARVIKAGGFLHIWHLVPRGKVNEIHASAGGPIGRDVLPPAPVTADIVCRQGFRIEAISDDETRYLVSAVRLTPGRG